MNLSKTSCIYLSICVLLGLMVLSGSQSQANEGQWANPYSETPGRAAVPDSITLKTVRHLVGKANVSLKAGHQAVSAKEHLVDQAGRRPNPELEIEAEEVGGDLAGFRRSEFSVGLSQEFELWGKRKTRTEAARRDYEGVQLETAIAAFDIFAEARLRFFELVYVQKRRELSEQAVALASELIAATKRRVESGAAPPSERLLAELAGEQASLEMTEVEAALVNARQNLASLWMGKESRFMAIPPAEGVAPCPGLPVLLAYLPESRDVARLKSEEGRLTAQLALERAASRPGLTISGGIKRLEADGHNTFMFGVALPLPLFDRNQGRIGSLRAQTQVARLMREQALTEAEADLRFRYRRLQQLSNTYLSVDTLLLPKAEETFTSLRRAYEMGKISYSSLAEGERLLIDLRFRKNDLTLSMAAEAVAIERILGITFDEIIAPEKKE